LKDTKTSGLAALWLQQHEAVNKYVMASTDRFLNIRGGAGVGKTYFMERLVRASLDAGRPVALVAPYGEQSRVTLRSEAERLSRPDVAAAFREANTVAWLLNKTRFSAEFRNRCAEPISTLMKHHFWTTRRCSSW